MRDSDGSERRRARAAATALRVLGGAQLASTGAYLLLRGPPRLIEGIALAVGNVYPFVCAAWARRPGAYTAATRTALGLAIGVTTTLALATGCLRSPFALILITIPSADFSASGPRGVVALGGFALLAALLVAAVDGLGWLDALALPAEVQAPATAAFLLHCIVVMAAVNLSVARARARATHDLAAARDAALGASQAKSAFLAMMSHELRTPLTGIAGLLELLAASPLEGETRRHVDAARASARALRAILDDILDLSKIEAGRLEIALAPGRPSEVLRAVADLFAVAARDRGIDLRVDIDPRCEEYAMIDAARLRQIISNLVGNAVKFTDRGHVGLSARVEPGDPPRLVIVVVDSGIGIPPERVAELFQPFVQVHGPRRAAGGTGLGLAISRRLVEMMGGTIAVSSAAGVGSTFTVDAPLTPAQAPAQAPVSVRLGAIKPGGVEPLRVLVAEDSPIVRMVLDGLLRRLGHPPVFAEDGQQAVERAKAERFDLILMDMQMPVLDGLEATRAIRELPPPNGRARIAGLSADAFAESRALAIEAGCDDYLLKPIELEALSEALATAIRLRDQQRRAAQ